MGPILTASLLFTSFISVALADFHIQALSISSFSSSGSVVTIGSQSESIVYVPSNQFGCGWLGENPSLSDASSITIVPNGNLIDLNSLQAFTSAATICGVQGMQFTPNSNGGFDFKDGNGNNGGSCSKNLQPQGTSCGSGTSSGTVQYAEELFVCFSNTCSKISCSRTVFRANSLSRLECSSVIVKMAGMRRSRFIIFGVLVLLCSLDNALRIQYQLYHYCYRYYDNIGTW